MTPAVAARFAAAFGTHLFEARAGDQPPSPLPPLVVVGRDSRPSGSTLQDGAVRGLCAVGCRVVRLGVQTTPSMAVAMGMMGADGGMVITASHNPGQWNGLKCLVAPGCAPALQDAQAIISTYETHTVDTELAAASGTVESGDDQAVIDEHVRRVLASIDPEQIRQAGFAVVLDSVNGAGGPAATALLAQLGVTVVGMNLDPTGLFAHEPEPIKQNLTGLASAVAEHGVHLGFAQDPDADRLAVVDETGRYIGEEYTLALAARYALNHPGADSGSSSIAVTNLSTSRMIDDVAAEAGVQVVRTPVGEANVAEVIQGSRAVIGGEGNGGVVWPPVCHVRDSLSGMALILSLLASDGRPLSTLVDSLPSYVIRKTKIDLPDRSGIRTVLSALAQRYAGQQQDTQDGLRVDWPEQGCWLHVRPSNTEPIMRLIVEGPTEKDVERIMNEAMAIVTREMGD